MADFPFLFAIGWLELIIFIVVFIIPLISQMFGSGKEAKEARRKQRPARPQPPQKPLPGELPEGGRPQGAERPQVGERPQGGGRGALEAEIEEFLSRAKGSQRRQQPKKVPPQIEQPEEEPRRLVPARAESSTQQAPHGRELGRGVADHVREHIESAPISEHASQLGRDVGQADEKLEGHIHEVFDHQLGNLRKEPTNEPSAEGTDAHVWESSVDRRERSEAAQRGRAEDIASMLRDPESVQQAIILSEILRRPE